MQNEDEQYKRVLSAMENQPLGPSTVDVGLAMETGKRRRRKRRLGMAATAAGLSVVVAVAFPFALRSSPRSAAATATAGPSTEASPTAPAKKTGFQTRDYDRSGGRALPTSCSGVKLPVPGGGIKSYVSNLDPSGRYVTGRVYDGNKDPMLWQDGKATRVPFGGDDDNFEAANTTGDAVGFSYPSSGPKAKAYIDGTLIELAGGNAEATGINDLGVISGVLVQGRHNKPVMWSSVTSQPTRLGLPDGVDTARANDIDEDGTIVGSINDAGERIAYVWYPDGTFQALPTPVVDGKPAKDFDARRVRNGWVTGYLTNPKQGSVGVRWDLVTGKATVLDGLNWSNDVSPLGWIVGMDTKQDAVLTDGVATLKLPNVFPKPAEYGMNWGEAISDDGLTIAGLNDDKNNDGEQRGVVWKCQ